MFRHYILTAVRQLKRKTGITLIHIVGLGVGITCALLIQLTIRFEKSFDTYHSNADRIYRVETTKVRSGNTFAGTPTAMVSILRNEVTGIEKVVPIQLLKNQLITVERAEDVLKTEEHVFFTDSHLFDLFDFDLLLGSESDCLNRPNEVILSASCAQKYFGRTDVVGKTLTIGKDNDLLIAGIIADPPINTDFRLDIIASYQTLASILPNFNFDQARGWNDNHQTYILLNKQTNPKKIARQFPAIVQQTLGSDGLKERAYALLPLSEIHYGYNFSNRAANSKLFQTLSIISILILVIACTNFINLATAQAFQRAKEVAVRKVFGSSKMQLMGLFLLQTGIISLLCVGGSLGLGYVLAPSFMELFNINMPPHVLNEQLTQPMMFLFLFVLWIAIICMAGLYPAIVSAYLPVMQAKNESLTTHFGGLAVKNIFVATQYVISTVLIIGTIVVSQQLKYFTDAPLGFDKYNLVTIRLPENTSHKLANLQQQLIASPYIAQVSFSNNSPSSENNFMSNIDYIKAEVNRSVNAQMKYVDEHFVEIFHIDLVAGKTLSKKDTTTYVLINEVMVQKMGLTSPETAIGEKLIRGDETFTIKGVVQDFHVNSLHQSIDPTIILIRSDLFFQANIKLAHTTGSVGGLSSTMKTIQHTWEKIFPNALFQYEFLDQKLNEVYHKERLTARLAKISTLIAIVISCLGILGLAMFTSYQRLKEMAIRKVLGATGTQIFILFVRQYLIMALISIGVAIPIAWWVMDQWLQNFAFRIELGIGIFFISAIMIMLMIMLTIGYQSLQVARLNPMNSLRDS